MTAAQVPEGFPKLEKQTRPWVCKRGNEDCTRKKPCVSCRNRRNRNQGRDKQRAGVKAIEQAFDVSFGRFQGQRAHEENMRGPIRIEAKSGAQCGPAATRFLKSEAQSEAARPLGDTRPFAEVLMPYGWGSDGIFSCRLSKLREVFEALTQ